MSEGQGEPGEMAGFREQVEEELERLGNESAIYESARNAMRQGMEDVLSGLQKGEGEERTRAALQIRKLTKTSAKSRSYLAAAGVIMPLVAMLKAGNSDESKEASVLALLNLSVGNERNKVKIVSAGAVEPLVELLRSRKESLREAAAATMLTLSAAGPNKPVIGASGVTPLLVDMLDSSSALAKVDALMALYNLSTHEDNMPRILISKPVGPLITLLKESKKSCKVAERCTALLEGLAAFEKGVDAIGKEEGGILALVEVLEDGSLQSRERAVSILLSMCQSSRERYRDAILGEGAIPGLLELTVLGTQKGQTNARTLLQLLRDLPSPAERSDSDPSILESIVYDIANHVDSEELGAQSARKMLTEMVPQLVMEHRFSTPLAA